MPSKHSLGGPHFYSSKDYDQLPLSADGGFPRRQESRAWKIKMYSRQCRRPVIGILVLFGLLVLYLMRGYLLKEPLPPLYKQWLDYEMKLPQHNLELRFPEGQHARYIFNANHVINSGFGNSLQETVFNAQLAYVTRRAFVFNNYTWNRDGGEYSYWNGRLIPSSIPLSAIIAGPIVGGSFNVIDSSSVPRAVSKDYFDIVCPKSQRVVVDTREIKAKLEKNGAGAKGMMKAWSDMLNAIPEKCVEIEQDAPILFDYMLMGSTSVLDYWSELSVSPILQKFTFSPLIISAYHYNRQFFTSLSPIPGRQHPRRYAKSDPFAVIPPSFHAADFLPELLVLHLRRNDFEQHCYNLATWGSRWHGMNSLPEFPDKFNPPDGESLPEKIEYYRQHCFPTIPEIVARVSSIRKVRPHLKQVYIMSNGKKEWLNDLKTELFKEAKQQKWTWRTVSSSRDLRLTWEQKYVSQGVDMYVAIRAGAMVGNGFSSLTSNIVMLRMARGTSPNDTLFW